MSPRVKPPKVVRRENSEEVDDDDDDDERMDSRARSRRYNVASSSLLGWRLAPPSSASSSLQARTYSSSREGDQLYLASGYSPRRESCQAPTLKHQDKYTFEGEEGVGASETNTERERWEGTREREGGEIPAVLVLPWCENFLDIAFAKFLYQANKK